MVIKPRARELGVPFGGVPGRFNAITDVAGVLVGFETFISGGHTAPYGAAQGYSDAARSEFRPDPTKPVIRTGVTAIFPRGRESTDSCFAATFDLNGNGELTGTHWIDESGFLDGPITLTNTHSVGVVRDAVIAWQVKNGLRPESNSYGDYFFSLPVVGETADFLLNDMNGFHVRPEHVWKALDSSAGGPVAEGNVGGGTGMICHGWKGGTGTASRIVGRYVVGVLVQANHGNSANLTISGAPVGDALRPQPQRWNGPAGTGSIIVVLATDAPLLPTQLKRLARRITIGIARTGGLGENSSGDLFLAFSTANPGAVRGASPVSVQMLPNSEMDPLFNATAQATEEAIVNALFAADTMTGASGATIPALPQNSVLKLLGDFGRLGSGV